MVPVAPAIAVGRALAGWIGQRKSNPGVYTMGNQKYLDKVAKGQAQLTDAWLNNRAARDLPKLEKLLQVQPGARGPLPSTADVLSSTPSMPGGAWATPLGVQPATGSVPPMQYGVMPGGSGGGGRRKARRKSKTRSGGTRRKSGGRKLKFGSPAWRKKYLGKKNSKVKRAKRLAKA